MKAKLIEYNESGKVLRKSYVSVTFASSNNPPLLCIELPDKQFRHRSIEIPTKQLLQLIVNRLIDKVFIRQP